MRHLRTILVVLLCVVAMPASPPPADAHTGACVGQGTLVTTYALRYRGMATLQYGVPLFWSTRTDFSLSMSTSECVTDVEIGATGQLDGNCGEAWGSGTTSTGHRFRIDWWGDELTLTPLDAGFPPSYDVIGVGRMEPDTLNGEHCFLGAKRFLATVTWAGPVP